MSNIELLPLLTVIDNDTTGQIGVSNLFYSTGAAAPFVAGAFANPSSVTGTPITHNP
jgi:hypothetical protein